MCCGVKRHQPGSCRWTSAEVRRRPPGCVWSSDRPCVSPGIDTHPHRNGGPVWPGHRIDGAVAGLPAPLLTIPGDPRRIRPSRAPSAGAAHSRCSIGIATSAAADIPESGSASGTNVCHARILDCLPLGASGGRLRSPSKARITLAIWPRRGGREKGRKGTINGGIASGDHPSKILGGGPPFSGTGRGSRSSVDAGRRIAGG